MTYKITLSKSRQALPKLIQIEEQLISDSPKPMIKRDIAIFKEFCLGQDRYVDLALKYDISHTRASQVVKYVLAYVEAAEPAKKSYAKSL